MKMNLFKFNSKNLPKRLVMVNLWQWHLWVLHTWKNMGKIEMNLFIFNHSQSIAVLNNWIYPAIHALHRMFWRKYKNMENDHENKIDYQIMKMNLFKFNYKNLTKRILMVHLQKRWTQPKWIFLFSIIQNLL